MSKRKALAVPAAIAMALLSSVSASAACKDELAKVDAELQSINADPGAIELLAQFRDQAATLCADGRDQDALQMLSIVSMGLAQVEGDARVAAEQAEPAAPPERPVPAAPAAAPDFPNRWDKLSQVDFCAWLTAEELGQAMTWHAPLTCRRTDHGFRYELPHEGDDWPVAFMLIVEVHPSQDTVRRAEINTSEGFSKRLFTPFDPGTPELHVYVSNKGHYLYAFPAGGLTLWRLEYLPASPRRDRYYSPSPGRSGNADLGPRFLELLVDKYRDRL